MLSGPKGEEREPVEISNGDGTHHVTIAKSLI